MVIKMKIIVVYLIATTTFLYGAIDCKKTSGDFDPKNPDPVLTKVTISIDKATKYQTIDGFGFFGAYDVWWGKTMWNDAWGEKVISDLGITIWRNEWFPPSIPGVNQDADWNKQKPVVIGLKAAADKFGVNLKNIVTVWSPPADIKWQCSFTWAGDANATRNPGVVSTKNGGTLNPDKYAEYADRLKTCIQSYKDVGVDLYAISLQNEPMFSQSFNSCTYTNAWYCELLNNVVPKIKSTWPNVKIFGAENMLEMEGKDINWPVFYHSAIKNDASAKNNLDLLAVHGYTDGVSPSTGSELAKMWANHLEQFSKPMNKTVWMTETSGYVDSWEKSGSKPGALNLAMDICSGLIFGNMSGWVWWQGSELGSIGEYNLMNGTTSGKKYYASKHYYRFVRPGAVRVKSTSDDSDIFVSAFEHISKGTNTIVIVNAGATDKSMSLEGAGLSAEFSIYLTTSGADNCKLIGTVKSGAGNSFVMPAKSIVTLQAGGDTL
jgi:O-glycosyl hydrolase